MCIRDRSWAVEVENGVAVAAPMRLCGQRMEKIVTDFPINYPRKWRTLKLILRDPTQHRSNSGAGARISSKFFFSFPFFFPSAAFIWSKDGEDCHGFSD